MKLIYNGASNLHIFILLAQQHVNNVSIIYQIKSLNLTALTMMTDKGSINKCA